jgi:hypothetical protein
MTGEAERGIERGTAGGGRRVVGTWKASLISQPESISGQQINPETKPISLPPF